jgi:periplasmic divalent cation tolerance protein
MARALVDSRLAACVHVTALTSVYRWQGSTETAAEWSCQIKTTAARAEEVMEQVKRLHSYQVPEILVVPVIDGSRAYLAWVAESVRDS